MSLSHMENMPLSHSSPQAAQRPSWKQWLLYSTIVILLLLCSFGTLVLTFLPLKTANEPCVAKFGAEDIAVNKTERYFSSKTLYSRPLPSKWQMASPEPPCVHKVADWKLRILQNGLYLIYGQVDPNTTYKEVAPFEVRLCKNEDIIQTLTDNSKIQTIGGTYELHAGDIINLLFNSEHQVLKNSTYWGILLLAKPQFIS